MEKKWFVFINDHHEGPFSPEEIQEKMAQGVVTFESFVWAEGMPDWQALSATPELKGMLTPVSVAPPESIGGVQEAVEPPPSPSSSSSNSEKTGEMDLAGIKYIQVVGAKVGGSPANPLSSSELKKAPRRPLSKGLLVFCFIAAIAAAYMQGLFEPLIQNQTVHNGMASVSKSASSIMQGLARQVPVLSKWISPIPALEDVTHEEYEELKAAAMDPTPKEGGKDPARPQFAIALSKSNPLVPAFYVAGHVPDGTKLQLHIVGVPETLLNQLSFNATLDVTLNQKLAKSNPLRTPEEKPVPRGDYKVYLTLPGSPFRENQTNKALRFKTYFLGGARDAQYATRLRDFHEKVQQKSSEEVKAAQQFLNTLESQLASTTSKFTLLKRGKITPKQRQQWEAFHQEWGKLQGQLDQIFAGWTADSLKKDYYFDGLFRMTQQVGAAVSRVHRVQNALFSTQAKGDLKTLDIQVGEAVSSAQSTIALLKARIVQVTTAPLPATGLPNREGI